MAVDDKGEHAFTFLKRAHFHIETFSQVDEMIGITLLFDPDCLRATMVTFSSTVSVFRRLFTDLELADH